MSRELDAEVAEKVMRWHIEGDDPFWLDSNGHAVFLDDRDCCATRRGYLANNERFCEAWSPSTNIADAWHVVSRLKEQGISIACNNHGSQWEVEVVDGGPTVWAETLPNAICHAALKSVEQTPS